MKFSVEKIVGGTNEQKKSAEQTLRSFFETQNIKGLSEIEVEKTSEVMECIKIANKVTSEILERYGIERDDVDADNIHVVKKESWPERFSHAGAFFRLYHQFILLPEGKDKLVMVKNIIHEIFHFKSYLAAQVLEDGTVHDYRLGLTVTTRDRLHTQLMHINEAITEELTYEAHQTDSFKKSFAENLKRMEEDMYCHSDAKQEDGTPLFSDQTFYVQVGEKSSVGTYPVKTFEFDYQTERRGLNLLIDKLYEHNKEVFGDAKEVYQLFVKSAYSGNLLTIGRLVDSTFAAGTFRKISNQESSNEFLKIVEDL